MAWAIISDFSGKRMVSEPQRTRLTMLKRPYTPTALAAMAALKPMSRKWGIHWAWKPVMVIPVSVKAAASSQKALVRVASGRVKLTATGRLDGSGSPVSSGGDSSSPSTCWPTCSGLVRTASETGSRTAMVMRPYQSQASRQPNSATSKVMNTGKSIGPDASPMLPMTNGRVRLRENHFMIRASHMVRLMSAVPKPPMNPYQKKKATSPSTHRTADSDPPSSSTPSGMMRRGARTGAAQGPTTGPSMPASRKRRESEPKSVARLQPSSSSMGTRNVLRANCAEPRTNEALTAPPIEMTQP